MRHAALSEWLKLRRSGMLAALATAIAVTTLGTIIGILSAGDSSSKHGFANTTQLTHHQLISSHGLADALGGASLLLGVITLAIVAASVAGEYSAGTLRNLLIRQPHRRSLLLGKLLGLAIAVAGAVIIASLVADIGGIIAATSKGINIHAWGSTTGIGRLLAAEGELVASTLGWGLLGALLAIVFRSPVVAIGVGVVYALPLENIIGGISNGVSRWLPGKLFAAIAAGGNSTASFSTAAITVAVYAGIALALCIRLFTRRDVAA
jgi:ABC-2 type transport system permease protein